MAIAASIPLQEYLTTSYEPDVDYLDGELEERNVGEYDHNAVQGWLYRYFHGHGKDWNIRSILEQRTRLTSTRYRIPDVSVFRRDTPVEQIFTHPQLIAIEVLSPEDRHSRMQARIEDYIKFQVPHIWVVEPTTHEGWDCSTGNWVRKERFEVVGTPIYLALHELFSELDAEEA